MEIKAKPELISIVINLNIDTMIMDRRPRSFGNMLGTIRDIAKQYGMIIKEANGITTFTAPKSRIQVFVEKLHFAGIQYFIV